MASEVINKVRRRGTQGNLVKRRTVATVVEESPPAPELKSSASSSSAPKTVHRRSGTAARAPIRTATVPETTGDLRETFPRYAAAFDLASSDGSTVSLPESFRALFQVLDSSSSSAERPWEKMQAAFEQQDTRKEGRINFECFCALVRHIKNEIALAEQAMAAVAEEEEREEEPAASSEESDGEDAVQLIDGKVFFKEKIRRPPLPVAPRARPKASAAPVPRNLSVGDLGSFALRTTVLPPVRRHDTKKGWKLSEWRTIRKHPGSYGVGCGQLKFSIDGEQLAATFAGGAGEIYDMRDMDRVDHSASKFLSKQAWEQMSSQTAATVASSTKQTFGKSGSSLSNQRWKYENSGRSLIATVDTLGFLQLWDVFPSHLHRQPELAESVEVGIGSPLSALCFSRDGSRIYTGGTDRKVYCFDLDRMSNLASAEVLGSDSMVGLRGRTLDNLLGSTAGHTGRVSSICAHPLSTQVLFSGGTDKQICLWDLRKGNTMPAIIASGPLIQGDSMDIAATGSTLLTGSYGTEHGPALQLHDVRRLGQTLPAPVTSYSWNADEDPLGNGRYCTSCNVISVSWDRDTRFLCAAGEKDNLARVFKVPEAGSSGPLHILTTLEHSAPFSSIAIDGDGTTVAVGTADGAIQVARISWGDIPVESRR